MKKYIFIILISFLLTSCGTVGKLLPSFAYNKDNQSNSSSDTLSQSVEYANLALSAGDNKSKNYNKSNIKSRDLNSNSTNEWGNKNYLLNGKISDFSKKYFFEHDRSGTRDSSYTGSSIVVHNDSMSAEILNFVFSACMGFYTLGVFLLGWYIHAFKIRRINKKSKKV